MKTKRMYGVLLSTLIAGVWLITVTLSKEDVENVSDSSQNKSAMIQIKGNEALIEVSDSPVIDAPVKEAEDVEQEKIKDELAVIESTLDNLSYIDVSNNEATSMEDRLQIQKLLVQRELLKRKIIIYQLSRI